MRAKPRILFNASVVLSGFASPSGGSGKLLGWIRKGNVQGFVSEIILDEIMRHRAKLSIPATSIRTLTKLFTVVPAPPVSIVRGFEAVVVDVGDAHVLASAKEYRADFLVTLDKKHLLALRGKIRMFRIVSPKELIERIEHGAG